MSYPPVPIDLCKKTIRYYIKLFKNDRKTTQRDLKQHLKQKQYAACIACKAQISELTIIIQEMEYDLGKPDVR